jgi:hypothetical protein
VENWCGAPRSGRSRGAWLLEKLAFVDSGGDVDILWMIRDVD